MEKNILENGLTVLYDKRNTDSVSVEASVSVGSINEPKALSGISHYIEHMLFEGTKKRPDARRISYEIESVGGELNAETSYESTSYFVKIPKKYFTLAVDVLSDLMTNPLLKEETFEKERHVILDEIKLIHDNPRFYQLLLFKKALYPDHQLGSPPVGSIETVSGITREDIIGYYQKHYVPENMVVSVVGDVGDPLPVVRKAYERMQPGTGRSESVKPVKARRPYRLVEEKDTGQSYMIFGYDTVPRSDPDSYALDLVEAILGRGMSGWLMDELRTKRGLAYDVGVEHSAGVNYGIFFSNVSTQKANLPEVETVIRECLERIKTVNEKQLESAKDYVQGSFLLQNEDTLRRASTLRYLNTAAQLETTEDYVKKVREVTLEDLKKTTTEHLNKDYTIAILKQKD
ncbi:MAG: pitrilysin family protein [Candidatus Altiarchaeota archaeon]